jgi:hypothetical protein
MKDEIGEISSADRRTSLSAKIQARRHPAPGDELRCGMFAFIFRWLALL